MVPRGGGGGGGGGGGWGVPQLLSNSSDYGLCIVLQTQFGIWQLTLCIGWLVFARTIFWVTFSAYSYHLKNVILFSVDEHLIDCPVSVYQFGGHINIVLDKCLAENNFKDNLIMSNSR